MRTGLVNAVASRRFATLRSDGGRPVVLNRTNFFGSYEGWRARVSNIVVFPWASRRRFRTTNQHRCPKAQSQRPGDATPHRALATASGSSGTTRPAGWRSRGRGRHTGTTCTRSSSAIRFSCRTVIEPAACAVRARIDVRRDLQPSVHAAPAACSGGLLGPWGFGADPEDS